MFVYFSPSAGDAEETSPDIVNEDAMECKILSNSYKLKFVEGGQSIFYKKRSLPKARVVSKSLVKRGWKLMRVGKGKFAWEFSKLSLAYVYSVGHLTEPWYTLILLILFRTIQLSLENCPKISNVGLKPGWWKTYHVIRKALVISGWQETRTVCGNVWQ